MHERFRPIATNLTPVNVVGIPGLTLVCVAIALAVQFPEARWLIAAGIVGGAAIAAALIVRRRRRGPSDDGDRFSNGALTLSWRHYGDHRRPEPSEPDRPDRARAPRRVCVPRRLVPLDGLGLRRS